MFLKHKDHKHFIHLSRISPPGACLNQSHPSHTLPWCQQKFWVHQMQVGYKVVSFLWHLLLLLSVSQDLKLLLWSLQCHLEDLCSGARKEGRQIIPQTRRLELRAIVFVKSRVQIQSVKVLVSLLFLPSSMQTDDNLSYTFLRSEETHQISPSSPQLSCCYNCLPNM